jgi:hypothetical protein
MKGRWAINGVQAEIYMEMQRASPDDFPNPEEPGFIPEAIIYLNSTYEGHYREAFLALGKHFIDKESITDSEISDERTRQDDEFGGPTHDDTHNMQFWRDHVLKFICRYTIVPQRDSAIKIVALCFAIIESIDRKRAR